MRPNLRFVLLTAAAYTMLFELLHRHEIAIFHFYWLILAVILLVAIFVVSTSVLALRERTHWIPLVALNAALAAGLGIPLMLLLMTEVRGESFCLYCPTVLEKITMYLTVAAAAAAIAAFLAPLVGRATRHLFQYKSAQEGAPSA